MYNPTIGQWMTRDPKGEAGGLNLYEYCDNDPINKTDPFGYCFAKGTMVLMADGSRQAIEKFERGQLVLACPDNAAESMSAPCRVVEVYHNAPARLGSLKLPSQVDPLHEEEIFVTAEHPFYVKDKGWMNAKDLKAGDQLRSSTGGWNRIRSFAMTDHVEPVFNLQVEGSHTYFVSLPDGTDVLAHNQSAPSSQPSGPAVLPPGGGSSMKINIGKTLATVTAVPNGDPVKASQDAELLIQSLDKSLSATENMETQNKLAAILRNNPSLVPQFQKWSDDNPAAETRGRIADAIRDAEFPFQVTVDGKAGTLEIKLNHAIADPTPENEKAEKPAATVTIISSDENTLNLRLDPKKQFLRGDVVNIAVGQLGPNELSTAVGLVQFNTIGGGSATVTITLHQLNRPDYSTTLRFNIPGEPSIPNRIPDLSPGGKAPPPEPLGPLSQPQ